MNYKLVLISSSTAALMTLIFLYALTVFKLELPALRYSAVDSPTFNKTNNINNNNNNNNNNKPVLMSSNGEDKKTIDVYEEDYRKQKAHFGKHVPRVVNGASLAIDNFFYRLVPQITCSTAVRMGQLTDGGKWSCNPWRAPKDCVVYSFGVSNEVSFEQELAAVTENRCRMYSFDNVDNTNLELFKSFNGTFRKWTIAGQTNYAKSQYSIVDIAANFSHSKIDFLKCDIEGAEYEVFNAFFASNEYKQGKIPVCQIYIEVHQWTYKIADFLTIFEKNDFYMFYKEVNYGAAKCCHEYSYIHKSCLQQYGVNAQPTHINFRR